jgi:hypothetical protein
VFSQGQYKVICSFILKYQRKVKKLLEPTLPSSCVLSKVDNVFEDVSEEVFVVESLILLPHLRWTFVKELLWLTLQTYSIADINCKLENKE